MPDPENQKENDKTPGHEPMQSKSILMPPDMISKVDRIARHRNVSFDEVVRNAVDAFVEVRISVLLEKPQLFARAVQVLGNEQNARQWFQSSVKGLGNKTPLECLDTEQGVQEVEDILGRIEYGVIY